MTTQVTLSLADEAATVALGSRLAQNVVLPAVIYLEGDLGAGKTTFSRGVMRGFGHTGAVKSPTYTLVEPYELGDIHVYHFDLYRLSSPEELEFMGIREYFDGQSLCLVEWPECGAGVLPEADLTIRLEYDEQGRKASLQAGSETGQQILSLLVG